MAEATVTCPKCSSSTTLIPEPNGDEAEWLFTDEMALKCEYLLDQSVFEKVVDHGHRRMRVAVAAMVMRVSATAVSCS
jgi:hypothetical protein